MYTNVIYIIIIPFVIVGWATTGHKLSFGSTCLQLLVISIQAPGDCGVSLRKNRWVKYGGYLTWGIPNQGTFTFRPKQY